MKKYLIHMDDIIFKQLKHLAIDQETTMKQIILKSIENYLKSNS